MQFKNYSRLLALAHAPQDGASIHDWAPFADGDKLTDIVDQHNRRCVNGYVDLKWPPRLIEELAEVVKVVPHDLSSVSQIAPDEYATIGILLVDVGTLKANAEQVQGVRDCMARHDHKYHLAQVSDDPGGQPCTSAFEGLAIVPSDPEILPDQAAFEAFLAKLCLGYRDSVQGVQEAVSLGAPRLLPALGTYFRDDVVARDLDLQRFTAAAETYLRKVPDLARRIRDAAMAEGLALDDIGTLARHAALQELALETIRRRVRSKRHYRVDLEGLRRPLIELPIDRAAAVPVLSEVGLVRLVLADPVIDLNPEQKHILKDLGVRGKTFTAVHFDNRDVWNRVEELGDAVKATRFRADLPGWLEG